MLREGRVWVAAPSSFNDPFDCQPSILRNEETEQRDLTKILKNRLGLIKRALRKGDELADRQLQPIPRRELVRLRRLLESHQPAEMKYQAIQEHFPTPPDGRTAVRILQTRLSIIGVFSLSATATNMLMWAHYAGQHTGFCLGFERAEGSLLKDPIHTKAVNYLHRFPELDLTSLGVSWTVTIGDGGISDSVEVDIQELHLQAVIYSKSDDWSYEQEWRVLVPEGGKLAPCPGPLRRVVFGLRCEQESRRRIREAAGAAASASIEFVEIESAMNSFELRIRDVQSAAATPT